MVKILLLLAALLSIGSAGLGFLNKSTHDQTKLDLVAKEAEIETRSEKIADLEESLSTTKTELETATSRASEAEQNLESTRAELSVATNKATSLEQLLEGKNTEITDLKGQLASLKESQPPTVEGAPTTPETETAGQVAQLQQQLEAAELEAGLMAEKVEAAQSRVAALEREAARREGQIMAKGLQGQVLAVNPAWNFVVLSLGDRQGVAPNAEMLVRRGGRMIGKIRVTSVEKSNSIADIVSGSVPVGMAIQPGDTVIYSGALPGS